MSLDEKQSKKALNKMTKLSEKESFSILSKSIEIYNSNPYKFLGKETPEAMERILLQGEQDGLIQGPGRQLLSERQERLAGRTYEAIFKEESGHLILAPLDFLLARSAIEEADRILTFRKEAVANAQ